MMEVFSDCGRFVWRQNVLTSTSVVTSRNLSSERIAEQVVSVAAVNRCITMTARRGASAGRKKNYCLYGDFTY